MTSVTNHLFRPGELTIILDGGAGSSGKARVGSFVTANADNWTFACNAFHPQAGHWTRLRDGRVFFYQTLNSCAYQSGFQKLYLGPGSIIELPALFKEVKDNNISASRLGISPVATILEEFDAAFERGLKGFDNSPIDAVHEGTAKKGSTCHGVGSAVARRALRRDSVRYAKDIPELAPYLCDVPAEITGRLENGESGLLELAQGFQLSLLHSYFVGYTTSRNVTVAHGLSDMFLPIKFAGQVIINLRTFPIRINSNKYIALDDGHHLTWAEVKAGVPHRVYEGSSGPCYPDQEELCWDDLTRHSGSPIDLTEITSVTKLPRRVFTFSQTNVKEAIAANDTGKGVHLSINFMNYVDHQMLGADSVSGLTPKAKVWLRDNLGEYLPFVKILGTGANTEDTILLTDSDIIDMEQK